MNKKVLITGATGFVGSYLVDFLLTNFNYKIFGTYYSQNSLSILEDNKDKIEALQVDLRKEDEVKNLILNTKPDFIYHLAAFTSPMDSFTSPNETIINNISSQLNILEQVRRLELKDTKILVVSSAEVYGNIEKEDLPVDEDTPFNPTSPYAVSKLAQDYLGKQYFLSYELKTIRVRPFNHIGPKQSPNFSISAFAKKIAEIEKGKRENLLTVGNLSSRRDFTDVRDVVRAYVLLMEKGSFGDVYNIGSGISYKISDMLDKLLALSDKKIEIGVDKALLRPSDNPESRCNAEKLIKLTGWKPEVSIEKTLQDTLDYWRNII